MITLHSSRYRHVSPETLRRIARRRTIDGFVFAFVLFMLLLVGLFAAGCTTLGERGHWTKQEQDHYLRTGK